MKEIKLNKGMVALVDDEDFDELSKFTWYVHVTNKSLYARRSERINGKVKHPYMHNQILGIKGVDHIGHDGLDNQKSNLRPASKSENAQNARKQLGTSSQYKGVCWHKQDKKWLASITINTILTHIGLYNIEEEAAKAYDKKALQHFNKFANLNFP